jgi:hypothetical protein
MTDSERPQWSRHLSCKNCFGWHAYMFSPEQIAELRAEVAAGAGHDCGEWVKDRKCELCDRPMGNKP